MTIDVARIEADSKTTNRVVESLVLRGDISALNASERARYYLQMCDSLGLAAASQPFAVLKLNGKEVLYPTRGATDQLAAIHRLNREIIDGPRVVDVAGTKMVYAVCRATHPNGRSETAVATVPVSDPLNALMKAETKAKRRATLSILGLGMLDEAELDTIPANVKSAGTAPTAAEIESAAVEAQAEAKYQQGAPAPQAPPSDGRDPRTTAPFLALVDALAAADSTESVVAAWLAHGSSLVGAGSDVFAEGKKEALAAWVAFGGENNMDALGAAVKAAREAAPRKAEVSTVGPRNAEAPADEKPRARSRKAQNAAPLDRAITEYIAPMHWRERIERDADAGHVAGGYHKRAEQWRTVGVLAHVRSMTVDRLCALLALDESSASRWLDGCAPERKHERRDSRTERRQSP